MATRGTPNEGKDNIIVPAVYTGLSIGLYTNAADSLGAATVLADITQPTGTGSADKTLSGAWSSTDGVVTYDDGTPDNVIFENTDVSTWGGGDVVGWFIHDTTYILHFKDLDAGPTTMTVGEEIEIDLSSLIV